MDRLLLSIFLNSQYATANLLYRQEYFALSNVSYIGGSIPDICLYSNVVDRAQNVGTPRTNGQIF